VRWPSIHYTARATNKVICCCTITLAHAAFRLLPATLARTPMCASVFIPAQCLHQLVCNLRSARCTLMYMHRTAAPCSLGVVHSHACATWVTVSKLSRACRLFNTRQVQNKTTLCCCTIKPTHVAFRLLPAMPAITPMCAFVFVPARLLHHLVCNSPSSHVHSNVHASHRSTLLPGGGSFTCLCEMRHCVKAFASLPCVQQMTNAKQHSMLLHDHACPPRFSIATWSASMSRQCAHLCSFLHVIYTTLSANRLSSRIVSSMYKQHHASSRPEPKNVVGFWCRNLRKTSLL